MRGGILALGLVLLVLSFIASSIFTAQQQTLLQIAGGTCNSALGTIGSALSSTVANDCQQVNTINTILSLVPIGYVLGGILVLLGLVIPGHKHEETKRGKAPQEDEEEEEKKENEALKTLKMRYAKGEITKTQYNQMKKDLEE